MNKKLKQKGFTLMEILIATAIFAMVMIIVVGTFSWVAGYNNRLKETRRVGQEVRGAMDQLTRDIRLANGQGKIGTTSIGEITLLYCSGSSNSTCSARFQTEASKYKADLATTTDPSGTTPLSNAILILKKDSNPPQAILYRSTIIGTSENYKFTMSIKDNINFDAIVLSTDFSSTSTITMHPSPPEKSPMSMQVYFGGYGAAKGQSRAQQPYAEIYLIGKTYNYNVVQPNMRSKFHLRTMVESRDYNP